ncbi:uncharacterized protein LOC129657671 [Bubalus kerabau]|uniref:uncharacterized protein LOC129657671 n=1 Tax=Bubalus carabanensis TaxID=3119969 RepID=UPI00244EE3B8|nr:uncharacterized protein LOC129657671 [Bubalus carabanensis]
MEAGFSGFARRNNSVAGPEVTQVPFLTGHNLVTACSRKHVLNHRDWVRILCMILLAHFLPKKAIELQQCTRTYLPNNASSAAAAESLQSCPTLCDPIDGSPPGSPIPGILQHGKMRKQLTSDESAQWKNHPDHWHHKWKQKLVSLLSALPAETYKLREVAAWSPLWSAVPDMWQKLSKRWTEACRMLSTALYYLVLTIIIPRRGEQLYSFPQSHLKSSL